MALPYVLFSLYSAVVGWFVLRWNLLPGVVVQIFNPRTPGDYRSVLPSWVSDVL